MKIITMQPEDLTADSRAQSRAGIDADVVAEYATAMYQGAEFPPVVAFQEGEIYFLADGFHRREAAINASQVIRVDVRAGGLRDAILYGAGANATHGLRRSNQDKRRAVLKLLQDKDWRKWSDREIARRCGVSHTFVQSLRQPSRASGNGSQTLQTRTVERGGRVYSQKVGRRRSLALVANTVPSLGHTETAIKRTADRLSRVVSQIAHVPISGTEFWAVYARDAAQRSAYEVCFRDAVAKLNNLLSDVEKVPLSTAELSKSRDGAAR